MTLFRSYFFRDLLGPLAGLVGLAVAVGSYETALAVSGRAVVGVGIPTQSVNETVWGWGPRSGGELVHRWALSERRCSEGRASQVNTWPSGKPWSRPWCEGKMRMLG